MKLKLTLGLSLFSVLVVSCGHSVNRQDAFNLPPKGPPEATGRVLMNSLPGGIEGLKGKKVHAFVIFNLPDGYLIRAKSKINPPDYAIKEVVDLQEERVSWLNEAMVVNCDQCFDLHAEPPLRELSEIDLLKLIDKVSLQQDPQASDWSILSKEAKKADYIWLIFGSEDYEQKRGPVVKQGAMVAWAQVDFTLRGFLYDQAQKKIVHSSEVISKDFDFALFPLPSDLETAATRKALSQLASLEDFTALEPMGSQFDSTQFDGQYPYPDVPEMPAVVRKGLLKLLELAKK